MTSRQEEPSKGRTFKRVQYEDHTAGHGNTGTVTDASKFRMCRFASGMEPTEAYRQASGNHMDIAEVAKRANVKTVVLTHMIHLLDKPAVMETLVTEMKSVYDGNIIIRTRSHETLARYRAGLVKT